MNRERIEKAAATLSQLLDEVQLLFDQEGCAEDEERIDALMVALLGLNKLVQPSWHPIESAPKDGTPVLTYDDGAMAIAAFADGYWWDNGAMEPPPTHWMPLPQGPEEP